MHAPQHKNRVGRLRTWMAHSGYNAPRWYQIQVEAMVWEPFRRLQQHLEELERELWGEAL